METMVKLKNLRGLFAQPECPGMGHFVHVGMPAQHMGCPNVFLTMDAHNFQLINVFFYNFHVC